MVELTEEQKASMEAAAKEREKRVVEVQYDTVKNTTSYASSGWGAVRVNHVKGEDEFNNLANSTPVIEHEVKHNDNNDRGIYAYPMSQEQIYKVNMHDEISANMAELVYLRDQYLKTGDISIFEKEFDGCFAFYAEAIKNGTIEPNSDDPEKFAQEMAFMVNGTQKMWMDIFSESYIEQNAAASIEFNDPEGKYKQFYDENYAKAVKSCYNIGGIDFSLYMQQDVEIPQAGLEKMEEMRRFNKVTGSDSYEALSEYTNAEITQKYGLPAYEQGMSMEEYEKLLKHHLAAEDFMSKVNESDYAAKANSSSDIMQNPQFKEDYNQSISNNSPFIGGAIDSQAALIAFKTAARECYEKDGKFPESDGVTYKKARDNLLCFDVTNIKTGEKERVSLINILNPEDNLPIYNQDTVTTRLEAIKESVDKHNSWWQKTKDWVADKKDKAVNWAKDTKDTAKRWIDKPLGEKISSLKDKFLGLFKKEEKADVKNEVINPIYHGEFREWKDENGSRVSSVMEKEILDLRQDVIAKPAIIKRPEVYDKWLEENNLLSILENMPNFIKYKMQTEAVKNAVIEEVSLGDAQPSTQNSNKDKVDTKSRMKRDSSAARKVNHYYQTETKVAQTETKYQTQTQANDGNSSNRRNFIPQRRGGMEM